MRDKYEEFKQFHSYNLGPQVYEICNVNISRKNKPENGNFMENK